MTASPGTLGPWDGMYPSRGIGPGTEWWVSRGLAGGRRRSGAKASPVRGPCRTRRGHTFRQPSPVSFGERE